MRLLQVIGRAELVNRCDHRARMLWIDRRMNPVAEIEHMPVTTTVAREHTPNLSANRLRRRV